MKFSYLLLSKSIANIMNWPVFFKRLGSAVVFCAVILAALTTTFEVLLAVTMLIQFFCIKETWQLFKNIFPDTTFPDTLYTLTQLFGFGLTISIAMASALGAFMFLTLLIPVILIFISILHPKNTLKAGMAAIFALLYVSIPLGGMISMYMLYHSGHLPTNIPLALILLIWTNDTMAYITGSFIGKTPFSKISPKKTWEGTIGGMVFTVLGVVILSYANWLPGLRLQDWIILAVLAAVIGTMGDLMESKLKRLANVKDSGNIMPGHGGALDRFDSLLATMPFVFCYVLIFMVR